MTKILKHVPVPNQSYQIYLQILVCWLILTPFLAKAAEPLVAPEYEVKMGFIFNFINFVAWPEEAFENAEETLSFCFASDHPAANVLFQLNDQSIRGRKLKVYKVEPDLLETKCHILFFGTDNRILIRRTIAGISGQHILTIGEVDGFTRMGGVINFFNQNKKLRFEVNIDAAKRENLKMGAGLLQSAQRIVKETDADRKALQAEIARQKKKLEGNIATPTPDLIEAPPTPSYKSNPPAPPKPSSDEPPNTPDQKTGAGSPLLPDNKE